MRCARTAAALLVATTAALDAQAPELAGRAHQAVVVHRAYGQAVGVFIHLPFGSADDPPGGEGTAWLFGTALDQELARRLRFSSALATVDVGRGHTSISMVGTPTAFESDMATLLDAVFVVSPSDTVINRIRTEHLAHLEFEEGAPVRDFQDERFSALFGVGHPWARPLRGTPETVSAIEASQVLEWGRPRYDFEHTTIGVVGPADTAAARRVLGRLSPVIVSDNVVDGWLWRPTPAAPADTSGVAGAGSSVPQAEEGHDATESPHPPASFAWGEGSRLKLDRQITSTWIAVGLPVSSRLPRLHLDLLTYHVREVLSPEPADPGVFSATVEVLDPREGPVIMITLAVAPESASRWEQRLLGILGMNLKAPPDDRFFSWERRRFRNALLREVERPDREAARLAADLRRGGGIRSVGSDAGTLTRNDLELAAQALGPARILVYGSELDGSEAGNLDPSEGSP